MENLQVDVIPFLKSILTNKDWNYFLWQISVIIFSNHSFHLISVFLWSISVCFFWLWSILRPWLCIWINISFIIYFTSVEVFPLNKFNVLEICYKQVVKINLPKFSFLLFHSKLKVHWRKILKITDVIFDIDEKN